jgi:uncharacterized RDD family membrane protein YckC
MAQVPVPPPPVQPPPSVGAPTARASFWQRLVAAIVDGLLLGLVGFIVSLPFGDPGFYERSPAGGTINFLVGIAYYIYFHGSPSGQTVGKKTMGIRVVGFRDGASIGYARAALRYVGSILSGIACLLGYLWMLWDAEKQTWHDKIADTVVVPESAAPVAKWPG